jgi:3,4-dihydroxy 2-butanone 4-phosphate synthase/GTP cyclohydrolase II
MVTHNDSNHTTAFTISVDYKQGTTTGISAAERVACCRALADPNADAADFIRPGHVFPLVARDGGVLFRSGHTEAGVDLCKLAGLPAVGVLSELMNDDGTVMKGPQVHDFARNHGIKYITIADIISYRQAREKLVERVSALTIQTPFGPLQGYAYRSPFDAIYHAAFVYKDIGDGQNVLTRFHLFNMFKDVCFSSQRVISALERFRENGSGVLIFLRDGAAGVPIASLGELQTREADRHRQWREVGLGAQILRDIGVRSIRHLTSSTHDYKGLSGFGIEIVGNEPFKEPVWNFEH